MLSYMRKKAGSLIIKILFGIIVIVFVFFYGFSDLQKSGKESVVASVGKRKISMNEYMTSYKNMIQYYRSIYKNQFSEEMIEKMGLKQKVLEDMIDKEILLQEAAQREIQVTPEEIRKEIMATPMFQENGSFSEPLYQRALNYFGISSADYEKDKEKELILKNLQDILTQSAKVSEKEVRDMYALQNEKVKIDYVSFDPDRIKEKITIPDNEIKDYYEKHKEEFKIPEQAKVKYLAFEPKNFESRVEVTSKEVEEFYETDVDQFAEPRKVKARHILFKVEKAAAKEKEDEIKKKAESALDQVNKGEDFEKLAKKLSEDTASAEKGGDLGYFKKGDMVKPFEEAAFSLKPGETSALVRSPFGFHIIRVEDVKEARTKPLEEVKDFIEKELRKEKAQDMVQQEAKRAFNRLFKTKNLEEYALETNMKLQTTDFFIYGKSSEDMPGKELFSKEAFALAPGDLSSAFAIGQKYFILKLEEKKETHIPVVEYVKEAIVGELEKQKRMMLANEVAQKNLALLLDGKEQWESMAKNNELESKEAEVRRTGDYIAGIGKSKDLKEACFALEQTKPYGPAVYQGEKGMVLVKLKEKVQPSEADFAKEKEKIAQSILQNKQRDLFEQFLQELKAKAETWVDTKVFSSL